MRISRAVFSLAVVAFVGIVGLRFAPQPDTAAPHKSTTATVAAPPASATATAVAYDRALYLKSWKDADHDCQDTRTEVLISESIVPVTFTDAKHCSVASGEWPDPYTGQIVTNPKLLDIDHLVPLGEVHASGGDTWSADRRSAYANDLSDPNTLIAVSLSQNRSKGDKDPAEWLPPNTAFRCTYIADWIEVKHRWGLSIDPSELKAIDRVLTGCGTDPTVVASIDPAMAPVPRLRPGEGRVGPGD